MKTRIIIFVFVLNFLFINISYAADPNTYIIKHRSGKPSKAILDKKFIHIQMPSISVINTNATDSSGLQGLSNQPIAMQPSQKTITKSKPVNKTIPNKTDKSTWDDYAVEGTGFDDYEELNVNAVLMH